MSKKRVPIGSYEERYRAIAFERAGLFELIQAEYASREVLYPGCSIHITPAFYFPHVVFVDRDPQAATFFQQHDALLEYVMRHRRYRRRPHIEFLAQDFHERLPVSPYGFDLLLALFTGGVARACWEYLKPGGLLLTNNHAGDAEEAIRLEALRLEATVRLRQGQYRLVEQGSNATVQEQKRVAQSRRYLRSTSTGLAYVENETYCLFRRRRLSG